MNTKDDQALDMTQGRVKLCLFVLFVVVCVFVLEGEGVHLHVHVDGFIATLYDRE